jgi:hypothetical protein
MPARWRRLVVVRRNGYRLTPGDVEQDDAQRGAAGSYWVEGPTQVDTTLAVSSAVLLTSTAWVAGDVLSWVYVQQAPLWTDPADATLDVVVDLATAEIARAAAHLAGAMSIARGDASALGRAQGELAAAVEKFKRRSRDLAQRPRALAAYRSRR